MKPLTVGLSVSVGCVLGCFAAAFAEPNLYTRVTGVTSPHGLKYFMSASQKLSKGDKRGAIADYSELIKIEPGNGLFYAPQPQLSK